VKFKGTTIGEEQKRGDITMKLTQEDIERSLSVFRVFAKAYRYISEHSILDSKRHGFNPSEFAVLEILYHKGPQILQQIGSRLLLVSGNMTYIADKLEKNGLIVREPSKTDRRAIYIKLTEKGYEVMDRIFPIHAEKIAQCFTSLTSEEQLMLKELLKKAGKHSEELLEKEKKS